jgi:hypothetical protein
MMLGWLATLAWGVPGTVTVMGSVWDGAAPVEGSREMTFQILGPSGGLLFTETVVVAVDRGAFAVELGATETLEMDLLATDDARALTVQLEDGPASDPTSITRVPRAAWATRAGDANRLGGELPSAYRRTDAAVPWGSLSGVPSGFDDGVDDAGAFYSAGAGLALSGTTFSASNVPWTSLSGVPGGFADGTDDGLVYLAGTGLALSGTTFSASNVPWSALAAMPAGAVGATQLADGAVTPAKLASGNWGFMGSLGVGTLAPDVALDVRGTGAIRIPAGTQAQRPSSPVAGMLRVSDGVLEFYSGTTWIRLGGFSATGGTVTDAGGYRIHTFTSDGTFAVSGAGGVEVLVVAGGGGGGHQVGGGGGGGGVVYESSRFVSSNVPVTVGAGGAGAPSGPLPALSGGNSSFGTLVAIGGGAGANHQRPAGNYQGAGQPGGSGGGGAGDSASVSGPGGAGTAGQGFAGGSGRANNWAGGGGGGAGQVGESSPSPSVGGRGGNGLQFGISGTLTYYGGGGGGCNDNATTPVAGGLGGGGAGTGNGNNNPSQRNGVANTGGGGGGVRDSSGQGGNGGSGIVIVRYPL